MSLFNSMRTAVSGMAAQSNALSAISDNIANSGTTGYKNAEAMFETVLSNNATSNYESGGVKTDIRYGVAEQGTLTTTTSSTDLAINGSGFFVVSKGDTNNLLTRAGSFIPDSTGNLVNAAGYNLMGYAMGTEGTASTLSVVNVSNTGLQAAASTSGTLAANLPSSATAVAAANLPSQNATGSTYTDKTSLTVYDNLGTANVLDVYMTKTGANTWEATVYQQSAASSSGGFQYSSGPVGTTDLTFSPTTGKFSSGTAPDGTATSALTVTVPNGSGPVPIDLSGMTQLATSFGVTTATANGNAPSTLSSIKIGSDGTVNAVYASGFQVATYKIPLAKVESSDNLTALSGNVYQVSQQSGAMELETASTAGTGSIVSDSLEQSTVDLATELTNMIQAQRGYEANSKVLQAASSLLGTLNQIQTN